MSWIYLFTAGLAEIGWPVGLKWAQEPGKLFIGVVVAVVAMAISGGLLFLAQKEIALGTAYAVWTGIGAAGTFLVGLWMFGDPGSVGRYLCVLLSITGVVSLKFAHWATSCMSNEAFKETILPRDRCRSCSCRVCRADLGSDGASASLVDPGRGAAAADRRQPALRRGAHD